MESRRNGPQLSSRHDDDSALNSESGANSIRFYLMQPFICFFPKPIPAEAKTPSKNPLSAYTFDSNR